MGARESGSHPLVQYSQDKMTIIKTSAGLFALIAGILAIGDNNIAAACAIIAAALIGIDTATPRKDKE